MRTCLFIHPGHGSFGCEGCIPDTVNGAKFIRDLYDRAGDTTGEGSCWAAAGQLLDSCRAAAGQLPACILNQQQCVSKPPMWSRLYCMQRLVNCKYVHNLQPPTNL